MHTDLDNNVRYIHASAQSWQPHYKLNWVHIMSNHHQGRCSLLHQSGNVVDAILDHNRLLLVCLQQQKCKASTTFKCEPAEAWLRYCTAKDKP